MRKCEIDEYDLTTCAEVVTAMAKQAHKHERLALAEQCYRLAARLWQPVSTDRATECEVAAAYCHGTEVH